MEYILISNGRPVVFPPQQVDQAASAAWDRVAANNARSLIVYVHGRAAGTGNDREPGESLGDGVFAELQREHRAEVLMVHWKHRAYLLQFPGDAATRGGELLWRVLDAIEAAKPAGQALVPIVVLTHSMGGISLAAAAASHAQSFRGVRNVVTSASAAPLENSAGWMSALHRQGVRVFVARNGVDAVLGRVARRHGPFLGFGDQHALTGAGLAPEAFYLDVSGLELGNGSSHNYFFVGPRRSGNAKLRHLHESFFGPVYRGEAPSCPPIVQPAAGVPIYTITL